ncbi:MAG: type II toxin-antitoxin system VapC family toxin [Verrucomicrobiae bacterium]|nr:type II toxin-antitoxin system VapC family toxin [Verrucomicrobiae bacterium]
MVTSADSSFLFSLYGNDVHTQRALKWIKTKSRKIILTTLSEYELGNALRFAEFRRCIAAGEATLFWAQFEADCASGRLVIEICNLAAVVNEARRISATHTLTGGHRSFDILHVAAALHLGASEFLTFDANQKKLAGAEGLKVPL